MEPVDKNVVGNTMLISQFYAASHSVLLHLFYYYLHVLNAIHIQICVRRSTVLKSVVGMHYNNYSPCSGSHLSDNL